MTGSACSGVPLGRSGADRFMNAKIKNLGGGLGGGWAKDRSGEGSIGGFFLDFFVVIFCFGF